MDKRGRGGEVNRCVLCHSQCFSSDSPTCDSSVEVCTLNCPLQCIYTPSYVYNSLLFPDIVDIEFEIEK